jgi:HPt (histidine-containing phosphotransfer) domain-containing protein
MRLIVSSTSARKAIVYPILDPAVLDTLRQLNQVGEPDVLSEVLGLFIADAPLRLEAISAAVGNGDARALQRAAHTLKGAAGTIGATGLQAACRTLEEVAQQGDLGGASIEALRHLGGEYARVKSAIDVLLADTGAAR